MIPPKILIVEPDADLAQELCSELESSNWEVVGIASSGEEGVGKAEQTRPDLIILDLELPGSVDGIEASSRIRVFHDAPVIYLADPNRPDHAQRAKDSGPRQALFKPINPSEFKTALDNFTGSNPTEKRVLANEAHFRNILESISEGFFALDQKLRVTYFNKASEELLGRKRDEVLGRPLFEAFPEAKGSIFEEKYNQALNRRVSMVFETYFGNAPYENWYDVRVYPLDNGISVYFQVVTQRKKMETELDAQKGKLEVTLRSIGDGVISADKNGRVVSLNKVGEDLTGWKETEAIGRPVEEVFHIIHEKTREKVENPVEKVLQTGMVIGLANHTVLVARDGTERILADSGAPIIDTDDKIIGVALVFRDVTEETLTQRRLSEEEARYRHIFESSNHLISLYSPVGKCLIMNPTVASYFNGKPEDFVGKSFIELHPEGGEEFERRIHEVIENWESREYEDPVNFPIGIRWLYSEVSPIHIPREDLTAAQIVSIDITDRKVAEEKLRESKELLQATGGIAKVGGWELDARTMEVKWTEETYRIHEVPLDYKPPLDEAINFFHPDDRPALQKAISEALQRGRPYDLEMRFITAKGRRLWTRTMCRPEVVDGEVVKLRGVFQDITELKEAEQLIESQNFHLKLSQRMARIGYWSFDIETGRPTWSDMMFTVLGRDPARGVPHYDEHREFIHPDDWELFDSAVQGAINGKPYIIELRIIFPDQSLHYVTAQGHPQVNEKGEVVTLFGTTQDITNRKRLEEQALSAERLRAVGELASGVAHNFNNLLQIVLGGSQLALTDLELGNFSQARRNLEQIVESARFGAQTVKRLQDFARFRKDKPLESSRVFDLSQTVDEAVEMSKPWWKTKPEKDGISITLSRKLHKGCYVEGNENEIFEVAVNLIKNAAEAMSKGGELRVRTFYDETNGYLIVEDQGVGISDADIKRIFDPFWSTKGPKGTGMGLASSYGIVQRHQGRINAQSREGYGTTFTVSIPLTGSAPVLNGSSTIPDFGFNLEILVVDDMPAVVKQLGSGLSTFGQSVYTALSGVEAVDIFRETRVDVVISDLAMPGMNGLALAREIQEISLEQRRERPIFIILTGWGAQVGDETRDEDSGVDAILQKPIDAAKLLDRIKELLNL